MKITEHMQLLQGMVDENPEALGLIVPVDSVRALLAYSEDRHELMRKYTAERTRANDYAVKYHSTKANYERLKDRVLYG